MTEKIPSRMKLEAARLASASLFALIVRLGIAPGFMGLPGGSVVGAEIEALILFASGIAITAMITHRPGSLMLASGITAVNLGLLMLTLLEAPILVSLTLLWLATLIARWLLPRQPRHRKRIRGDQFRSGSSPHHAAGIWNLNAGALLAQLVVVAMGFGIRSRAGITAWFWGVSAFMMSIPWLRSRKNIHRRLSLVTLALGFSSILLFALPTLSVTCLSLNLVATLLLLAADAPVIEEVIDHILSRPAILTCLSFFLVISLGTFLLALPAASSAALPLTPSAALFTATSATCVTGLIVVDTGHDLSLFGKIIVLALMQIGGLSIMVLSGFATMAVGARLGLKGAHALSNALDQTTTRSARKLATFVVLSTLCIEGIGTLLLTLGEHSRGIELKSALWHGVFHSVSAFCNAGFCLYTESLTGHSPLVLLTVILLITAGGLGFPVLAAGWARLRNEPSPASTLQVRLVLSWSAGLTLLGTLWFLMFEWQGALRNLSPVSKLLNALFQSVTLRTAGFNSISLTGLGGGSILLMMLLMAIGASPGGAGGGLKTTTLAVLLGAVPAAAV